MRAGPPQVAKRIKDELAEEKMVLSHVARDWRKFAETGDDAYLRLPLTISMVSTGDSREFSRPSPR
jgi:uncharacterized lipoprotein